MMIDLKVGTLTMWQTYMKQCKSMHKQPISTASSGASPRALSSACLRHFRRIPKSTVLSKRSQDISS